MARIQLLVVKDEKTIDMTNLVKSVRWSGRKGSSARTITVAMIDDDGYRHARSGIDVFRVFDSLNWIPGMEVAMDEVLNQDKICQATICYTGDILDPKRDKYTLDYYVKMAKELESGEFGIAPYPIYDKGGETERIVPASLWGYSISSGALHPEAAATYIRLEILVRNNIKEAHPGRGYLDTVLTEDEQKMLEDTADDQVIMEKIQGIGDCYNILDTQLVPPIYYNANEASVQAEIDAVKPLLQAEIDDYNSELAERG